MEEKGTLPIRFFRTISTAEDPSVQVDPADFWNGFKGK